MSTIGTPLTLVVGTAFDPHCITLAATVLEMLVTVGIVTPVCVG
jgi:hypothetical protein